MTSFVNIINKKINLLLFILFVFQYSNLFCQTDNALFDHLTVENGLSNSLIFEMTQDSLGFVWIATLDGLNRFDGYNFKVFRADDSVKSVSDNWISCITTDKLGNIWYGTRTAGIGKIDLITGEFISFKDQLLSKFGEDALNIQNLFITSDEKILIGTWGAGLLVLNPINFEYQQFINQKDNHNSISENRVYSVFQDSKGNIWAGTQRTGLNKLDINNGNFTHFDLISSDPNTISNNFVLTIEEDFEGQIWAGTYSDGLFKIDQKKSQIIKYNEKNNIAGVKVSKIYEDSKKDLWICTNDNGVYKYLRSKNEFVNYRNNEFNTKSLNSDKVWSIMEDQSGLLWFGTLTNGINIYNNKKNVFKRLIHNLNDKNTIANNYIKSLFLDKKGRLWIGSQNGISILASDKSIKHLNQNDGLNINEVRAIYERNNGEVWIGTWGGGINIFNPADSKVKYLVNENNNSNSLADNYLRCLLEVDNKIYIGTERGLNEYDTKTKNFKLYNTIENDSTSISNLQVTCFLFDKKKNFWVGTNSGLNIFNRKEGTFKRILIRDSELFPQRKRIRKIFEDSKENIWIGTLGAGFAKYNHLINEFEFYDQKDGLSNNAAFEILEDNEGYLWISTSKGLNKFDPVKKTFVIYTVADGLPNNEFNSGAAVINSQGDLYFGGVNGLIYFNPLSLKFQENEPKIEITKILINGNEMNKYGFYHNLSELNLPYNKNFIDITFSSLDFSTPESDIFSYKLDGLNDNWINSGKSKTAIFTNLAHGKYLFHIKYSDKNANWNTNKKILKIIVSPPWWDTIFARIIYIILLGFFIFFGFRLRINSMRRKQEQLEDLVNERTNDLSKSKLQLENANTTKDKLFSIIAHDLKNPFVSLLGYSEMLKNNSSSLSIEEQQESIDGIYNASNSVYSLLQNLLTWARLQLNRIDSIPVNVDINNIINNVIGIFSITASAKSIRLINNIKENTFVFADQDMIEIIFRNIISNSIKYTPVNGKVEISAINHDDIVEIVIKDNGVGIDEETLLNLKNNEGHHLSSDGTSKEKGTGLGIMLIKDFIKRNNGTFNIESTFGKGTAISICLPIMN